MSVNCKAFGALMKKYPLSPEESINLREAVQKKAIKVHAIGVKCWGCPVRGNRYEEYGKNSHIAVISMNRETTSLLLHLTGCIPTVNMLKDNAY